jgi:hypothetical protein
MRFLPPMRIPDSRTLFYVFAPLPRTARLTGGPNTFEALPMPFQPKHPGLFPARGGACYLGSLAARELLIFSRQILECFQPASFEPVLCY